MDSYRKQKEIEKITLEIIESTEDIFEKQKDERADIYNDLIGRLSQVFDEEDGFRPHYFFLFNLLENKQVKDLVNPIACIVEMRAFLDSYKISGKKKKHVHLKKYYQENTFKYKVDMFIEALRYELSFRRGLAKNEDISTNNREQIEKNANDAFEKIHSLYVAFENNVKMTGEEITQQNNDKLKVLENEINNKLLTQQAEIVNKIGQETSSLTTNMLTVLGIFVSILFVIISSYFATTTDFINIYEDYSKQVNLGRFVLMGHVLFNILFMFMFMISRLTGKKISLECAGNKNSLCNDCKNDCNIFKRIWKKYPYVVLANIFAVVAYLALVYWWVFERYISKYINVWWNSISPEAKVAIFLILPILFVLVLVKIFKKIKI